MTRRVVTVGDDFKLPAKTDVHYAKPGVDSTQRLMRKLYSEVSDASMMVIGDSTGYQTSQWVHLLAQSLGADWPRWTIKYLLINDGAAAYYAPVTIQTGTGPRTLTIYNASVPGYYSLYFQGTRANWAIFPYDPDLIMISSGHNEGAGAGENAWHSKYVSLTETVTERLTGDVILVTQNPETANPVDQPLRAEVYRQIAVTRGFGFIDVTQAFLDTGNVAALLNPDGVHPNFAGSQLWHDTVHPAFVLQPNATPRAQLPSTLLQAGEQLLVNGDFVTFPDHSQTLLTPGAWWADANTAITKDTANYESVRGWAVKLTATSAGMARLGQNIDPKKVRGRWVTVAYRIYIPTGQPQTAGWTYLSDNAGGSTSISGTYSAGAYQWIIATLKVSPTATAVNTYVLLDGANLAGATVTIDRVVMTYGKYPRASADNSDRAPASALALKRTGFSGPGSPEGVVSASAGELYTRTDLAMRLNEAVYPISDSNTSTTGWFGASGTLTASTGYLRDTLTGGVNAKIQTPNATTQAVSPSKSYTFSAQARSDTAFTVKILAQFYTAAGAATGTTLAGPAVTVNATTFVDVPPLAVSTPVDAAFVIMQVYLSGGTATSGQFLDARHVLIEASSTVGPYFDGSMPSSGGVSYAWTGTPNASTSTSVSTVPSAYVKSGAGSTGWRAVPQATGTAVPVAATDATTTQGLVNAMRSALIAAGLLS